jgi:hypothetical protein
LPITEGFAGVYISYALNIDFYALNLYLKILVPLASGCGYSPPKEHPRQNIEYIDMLYD